MGKRAYVGLFSAASLFAGCVLTSNFDGIDDGADTPDATPDGATRPPNDASRDAPEEGGLSDADAALDGGPRDADAGPPANDGASDASTEAGSDGGGFCSGSTHFFCTDFDRPSFAALGLSESVSGGGVNTLDTTDFISAPQSYRSSVPGSGLPSALLYTAVMNGTYRSFDLSFNVRIKSCPFPTGSAAVGLASVAYTSTSALGFYMTGFGVNRPTIADVYPGDAGTQFSYRAFSGAFPNDVWTRVSVRGSFMTNVTEAYVNGVLVATDTFKSGVTSPTLVQVRVGAQALGNVGANVAACEALFDNVSLDVVP